MTAKSKIEIEYCPGCRWLLRAAWFAQELLTTFESELASVALAPSEKSGSFDIKIDDQIIWSRHQSGRFPELKELKQLIRDIACPNKVLGHSDKINV